MKKITRKQLDHLFKRIEDHMDHKHIDNLKTRLHRLNQDRDNLTHQIRLIDQQSLTYHQLRSDIEKAIIQTASDITLEMEK